MLANLPDLPNLVTLAGLCVGFVAVALTVRRQFTGAMSLALVAIIIDQADGALARRDANRSEAKRAFGAHLDCYADFVSKGVFPAMFLLIMVDFAGIYWTVALLHLIAIAVRYSHEFVPNARPYGLSPDYSIVVFAIGYLVAPTLGGGYLPALAAAMLLLAALSVSKMEVPKLRGPALGAFVGLLVALTVLLLVAR